MIDIILPIYKPNDKVFEAIDSVSAQSYHDWHLFIVDDASNDNSLDKLKSTYSDYSHKITYFQFSKNQRAAACRNYAIKRGTGKFIAFIDQDDVWQPNKLKLQINYIKETDADVVHGNVKFIDNGNNVIMHDKWEKENLSRREVDWNHLSGEKLARQIFMKPNIRIISAMIKRDIFEKVGGFKEQFFGGEDETFWFEIALVGTIRFIDEILFYRRIHDHNTVDIFKIERLKGYTKAIAYLRKKHVFLRKGVYNDKFAGKFNAIANYHLKEKQYFIALIYIFRWFICNPMYLFKLSIFNKSNSLSTPK